ncbi:hypothetical protein [Lewinella sp. IMCC34191]|uniref:hypothetical protein n=1 Tax=Lewinella sp. IMCC34191 TaxID=2259172 RepID=UPI000E25C994|nr:hypothetical protein [Lewinella sp. IMCC34191]
MAWDKVRLISYYDNPRGSGAPVDVMMEDPDDESMGVVARKKHLNNWKKYQHSLAADMDDR